MNAAVRLAMVVGVAMIAGCTVGSEPVTTTTAPATRQPETTTTAPVATTTTTVPDIELAIRWAAADEDFDGQRIQALATFDGGFVAVGLDADGSSPRWWRSPDGLMWADTAIDLPGFGSGFGLHDLYAGGAGFLITGGTDSGDRWADSDLLWLSTDALEWQLLTPRDIVGPVTVGPYMSPTAVIVPAGVATSGFLLSAGIGLSFDVEDFLAARHPSIVDSWDHLRFGGELSSEPTDVLIFADEDGNELARLSTAELGASGPFTEELIEGVWTEGLWFSPNGHSWTEVTVGPGGGDPVPMEMTASAESFYVSRFQSEETVQTRTWRSDDGLSWEDVPFDSATPDFVGELAGVGAGAVAGVDIPGRATLWRAADDGGFAPLVEPPDIGFTPWMLSGGGAGLNVVGGVDPPSCRNEPCQFLPSMRMTFSADGMKWSAPTGSTAHFGMNSVLRSIVVGESDLLALVEYPLEGFGEDALDPTRLWVGTPTPQPIVPQEPEPQLGRLVHVWPQGSRVFTVEPEIDILAHTEPGTAVESVAINGEPVAWSKEMGFQVNGVPLEPGLSTFEIVLFGPGIEERTVREIWYLPDAVERGGLLRGVTADSITVDWVEIDDDSEFFTTYDDEPGLLETLPVSEEIVVWGADCSFNTIPYRYFVDLFNDGFDDERWEWMSYGIVVADGEVVQLTEWCFG